jgi:predicted DNA-binding transcriptional regulator AlpA
MMNAGNTPADDAGSIEHLRIRVGDLEKSVKDQHDLLIEMGAVVSDYRLRLKSAEAERDFLREASRGLKVRLDEKERAPTNAPQTGALPRALSTIEAAAHTGMGKGRLENLRVAGGGPKFMKLGRSVRYRVSDLDEWMDARLVENTSMLSIRS